MTLRTINDVKISPSGDQIAYTVSTPSVPRNAHEPALFVIPAAGGPPRQLAQNFRMFTPHCPRPACGGSPAGTSLCSSSRRTGRKSSASGPTTPRLAL